MSKLMFLSSLIPLVPLVPLLPWFGFFFTTEEAEDPPQGPIKRLPSNNFACLLARFRIQTSKHINSEVIVSGVKQKINKILVLVRT